MVVGILITVTFQSYLGQIITSQLEMGEVTKVPGEKTTAQQKSLATFSYFGQVSNRGSGERQQAFSGTNLVQSAIRAGPIR